MAQCWSAVHCLLAKTVLTPTRLILARGRGVTPLAPLGELLPTEVEYLELSDNLHALKTVVGKCTMVYSRISSNPGVEGLADDNAAHLASSQVWGIVRSFPQKEDDAIGVTMAGWLRLKASSTLTFENVIYFMVMLKALAFAETDNPIIN